MSSLTSSSITTSLEHGGARCSGHVVQFYTDDKFLTHELAAMVGHALAVGQPALIVATEAHRQAVEAVLQARGFDIPQAIRSGRYVALDAAETLSCFMENGWPNGAVFGEFIGKLVSEAASRGENGHNAPVIYGEMVALLLAAGNPEAAVRLEQLWNQLSLNHAFHLRCGYLIRSFDRKEHADLFSRICSEHTTVIPEESYTTLGSDDLRARSVTDLQQKAQALETEITEHLRLQEELERRVKARTSQLQRKNQELKAEIERRERAEGGLRALSSRLLAIRDEERRRIARELHDSTAQLLAALAMNLSMIMPDKDAMSPVAAEFLVQSGNLVQELLKEVRNLSQLLHPPTLDEMGLPSALEWYIAKFTERSHIEVTSDIPRDLGRLTRDIELAVFRLVQESLTNVQRHSGSATAHVRVSHSDNEIRVEIEDQGAGIAAAKNAGGSTGIGISGMRERIRQLQGTFTVQSDSNGTKISATIPCAK
ncbi:MAG TPA: MEDS domain-containing protein [Terriglobales bacterium]|nr:MEDS domain-containing protein [Terriglobales bacterium]